MAQVYQIDPGLDQRAHLEKLNFILRQIQKEVSLINVGSGGSTLGGSTGSSGVSAGGGSIRSHPALSNLDYAHAGHTGFVPSTRTLSVTAPLTGGGDLSADRTFGLNQPGIDHGSISGLADDDHTQYVLLTGVRAMTGGLVPAVQNLVDAATIATNAATGNHFRVTLGGNRILGAPTNPRDGQRLIWEFTQDGTGSRTITLSAAFVVPTNLPAITLTTTPGQTDMLGAIYNSALSKWVVTGFLTDYS